MSGPTVIVPPRSGPNETAATTATLWTIWMLGCVIAVAVCWVCAFFTGMTLFGTPITADQTATMRALINAAAVISTSSAVLMFIVAVLRRQHGLSISAVVALVFAFLSPWLPLILALRGQVAGE